MNARFQNRAPQPLRALTVALLLALAGGASQAVGSAPSPAAQARADAASAPAASASAPSKRMPQPQTAAQAAEKTQQPELRPENPVVPQLRIPLRADRGSSDAAPGSGAIDDGAARCLAEPHAGARQACLRRQRGVDKAASAAASAPASTAPRTAPRSPARSSSR